MILFYSEKFIFEKQIFVLHGLEDKVCNMKLNPKIFNPVTFLIFTFMKA